MTRWPADTVTLIRSGIRGLLAVAGERAPALRAKLARDDDYPTAGKPAGDYDDRAACDALVDALAKDAAALLAALDGEELDPVLAHAAARLASVGGPDLDEGQDGVFRIARRVAKDRIISTVDPQTRHRHTTAARRFDGSQGHVAIDPDSALIPAPAVTRATPATRQRPLTCSQSCCRKPPSRAPRSTRPPTRRRSSAPSPPEPRRTKRSAPCRRYPATQPTASENCWPHSSGPERPATPRSIGHLMRRRPGGRRARVRWRVRVAADFALLAATMNLARLSVLGLSYQSGTWTAQSQVE